MRFKDHFSGHAGAYARFRPNYPPALFAWIAEQAPSRLVAWDCACGSGQAAAQLAGHFDAVIATDASARQIECASGPANVEFRVAGADHSGLPARSVDAICVAQALHWFDVEAFYAEARRVARAGAVLAVWMYASVKVSGLTPLLTEFEHVTVGPYWPAERKHIDNRYAQLQLPGRQLHVPGWQMAAQWPLAHLLGYVGSWSAVRRYRAATGTDPLPALADELTAQWGDPRTCRDIRWPLVVRATRL